MNRLYILFLFVSCSMFGQQLKVKPHQLNIEPIYIDTLNNRIGIGTTIPSATVELSLSGHTSNIETNKRMVISNDDPNYNAVTLLLNAKQRNSNLGFGQNDTVKAGITYDTRGFLGFINSVYAFQDFSFRLNNDGSLEYYDVPSNSTSFKILSNGNVGIGTSSPSYKLHVYKGTIGAIAILEGSTGRTLFTGTDVGGHYIEATGTQASERVLRIQAGDGGANYSVLFINGANQVIHTNAGTDVGIGTTTPAYKLDVYQGDVATTGHVYGDLRLSGNLSGYANNTYATLKTSSGAIHFDANGTFTGYISWNTGFVDVSDGSLKTFVEPIQNATDILMNLEGVRYSWIDGRDAFETHAGFVAQQVLEHYPEAVTLSDVGIYGISSPPLIALAVTTIQEQQQEIEELKLTIQSLITRIETLENQ